MAIVAKKRGGALSGRGRPARDSGAARWKRAVPFGGAAVLLALAALLAWRFMGGATSSLPAPGEPPAPAMVATITPTPEDNTDVAPPDAGGAPVHQVVSAPAPQADGMPAHPASAAVPAGNAGVAPPGETGAAGAGRPTRGKNEKGDGVFQTKTEQMLSRFAGTRPGYQPPMLLRLPQDENLDEILERPIEIFDDDDDETVAAKENCARMKEELRQFMADGGSAETFMLWHHNELMKDYEEWRDAQHNAVQLLLGGDLDAARRYAEEASATLAERGIRGVTLPEKLVEKITRGEK